MGGCSGGRVSNSPPDHKPCTLCAMLPRQFTDSFQHFRTTLKIYFVASLDIFLRQRTTFKNWFYYFVGQFHCGNLLRHRTTFKNWVCCFVGQFFTTADDFKNWFCRFVGQFFTTADDFKKLVLSLR